MPLDHYIPQVHLKKFYSPTLGNRMYAIRKDNLKFFTPTSQAVCTIMDGSTNAYLSEERVIEEFLERIEPNYNDALDKLIAENIDGKCIYTIAGFIAYVIACSPAGMRLQAARLKTSVETRAAIMEAQGLLPHPPAGIASLTEVLRDGSLEVIIDPKFPQALGIQLIVHLTASFGNFKWEILHNNFDDNPFFTSDFPAAIEKTDDPRILNRIVPLAPNLALRMRPDPLLDRDQADFSFSHFRYRSHNVSHKELVMLNRLIVQCAEDSVFYRDDHPWVQRFIAKNRHYRIEPHTHRLATPTGTLLFWTPRIVATAPPV